MTKACTMQRKSARSIPVLCRIFPRSFCCSVTVYKTKCCKASSTDHKRLWMRELKRAVLDHFELAIPEETKRLMLSMDCTQPKISFGRPEFAEGTVQSGQVFTEESMMPSSQASEVS